VQRDLKHSKELNYAILLCDSADLAIIIKRFDLVGHQVPFEIRFPSQIAKGDLFFSGLFIGLYRLHS